MNTTTRLKYKTLLTDLRATLQTEINQSRDEAAPVTLDGTMGRVSRGDALQVQQMALEMRRRREQRLIRIQTALQRIERGTYGQCGRCQKPITSDRLDTFPEVVLCVHCASTPKR